MKFSTRPLELLNGTDRADYHSMSSITRQKAFFSINTVLVVVLAAGAALRIWDLGRTSFWLDEAGVAYAARMPTIAEMLAVVRSHVMAMPLDYLVVWLAGRIGYQEAVLRLPAAIWGISSLYVAYLLFKKIAPYPSAITGTIILALSPLHIQYSQELRFYASLVFFYLLSTLLLLNALQSPSIKRWAAFSFFHIVGIYFHPYVLLAWINGIIWISLKNGIRLRQIRSLSPLVRQGILVSALLSLAAFLVGYRLFSAGNFFSIPLMVFEEHPLTAIAAGLGWLPMNYHRFHLGLLWGWSCALLQMVGVAQIIRKRPRSSLAAMVYGLAAQVIFVIGSDLLGQYFFAPRQFIMLLPALCLIAGVGVQKIASLFSQWIARQKNGLSEHQKNLVFCIILAGMILASIPAIRLYRMDDKGSAQKIAQVIISYWDPGDVALITPSYDGFAYKYYLEWVEQRPDISVRLFGINEDAAAVFDNTPGSTFLITPQRITPKLLNDLDARGYKQIFSSSPYARYAKILWKRNAKND